MYDTTLIKQICGEAAAQYAANKNRGGRNNAQGATFENYYAATRATELFAAALQAGDGGADTVLQSQQLCFVDDLIIDRPQERRLSQLKSGAASWNGGDHPVAEDFRLQRTVDQAIDVKADYELVVSDLAQRESLIAGRPGDLNVDVIHFAYSQDFEVFLAANPHLEAAIDVLSLHDPKPSVRRAVFTTLVGAWVTSPERTTLADFATLAASGPGPLVPVLGPEYALPSEVHAILVGLGMDIEIRKKHLWYRFGRLSGYSAARGGTPEFTEFERFVVETQPTDAYDVIAALRGVP